MDRRKFLTTMTVTTGVITILAFAFVVRQDAMEWWYVKALESNTGSTKLQAAEKLGVLKSARALIPLLYFLQETRDDFTTQRLVVILTEIVEGSHNGREILCDILTGHQDSGSAVRRQAALIAGRLGGGAEFEELLPCLTSAAAAKDEQVREMVIWALRYSRDGSMVLPLLIGALKDQNANVRAEAAQSVMTFVQYKNTVIPALYEALDDDDPAVRRSVKEAISVLEGQES